MSPRANHALRTVPLSHNARAERRRQMQRRLGRSHPSVCIQPNALPRQHPGQPLPVIRSCVPQSADRCLGALEQENTGGLSSCRGAKRFASAEMAQLLHVAHRLRRRPPTTPYADAGLGDRVLLPAMQPASCVSTTTPTPHIKIASTSEERQRPASTTTTTAPTKAYQGHHHFHCKRRKLHENAFGGLKRRINKEELGWQQCRGGPTNHATRTAVTTALAPALVPKPLRTARQ